MTVRLSTKTRVNMVGSVGLAATFANGILDIYSGSQPTTADAVPTGTLLARVTLNSGAFTAGVSTNGLTFTTGTDGTISKSGVWSFNGLVVGTAGWFRLKANALDNDSLSTTLPRIDGSVATSGADLNLGNISIGVGVPGTIDQFTYTQPAQ